MLERWRQYFEEGLWDFSLAQQPKWKRFWLKVLRISYLSIRGFIKDECSSNASSLTYYTMMSIVPVLAMTFAIANGFGFHEYLRKQILSNFQEQNIVLTEIFKYSDRFLEQAKGSVIAGVGLLILFWTVCLLLNSLESILNQIWGVKSRRSWRRIFSDYFSLMLLGPILFVLFNSVAVFLVDEISDFIKLLPLLSSLLSLILFFVHLFPYGLFWILFTFFYIFMPNTRVQFSSALIGGFVGGSLYLIIQWGYIYFQIGLSRYGAVYGSMAALPLFLIWLQLSWFLFLFGAEISYAHQAQEEHEFAVTASRLSRGFKKLLSLWIVQMSASLYQKGERLSRELLIRRYRIPASVADMMLKELTACKLLVLTHEKYFIPAKPIQNLRISDVLSTLESHGLNEFPFLESKILAEFEKVLKQFQRQIEESPENRLMTDVPNML